MTPGSVRRDHVTRSEQIGAETGPHDRGASRSARRRTSYDVQQIGAEDRVTGVERSAGRVAERAGRAFRISPEIPKTLG